MRNPREPAITGFKIYGSIWSYVYKKTIWTIPIVLILATGIRTALAHSPGYLYGFGVGARTRHCKDAIMFWSNRPCPSTGTAEYTTRSKRL